MKILALFKKHLKAHKKYCKIGLFVFILLLLFFLSIVFNGKSKNNIAMSFEQFIEILKKGQVKKAYLIREACIAETVDGVNIKVFLLPTEQNKALKALIENKVKFDILKT